MKRINSRLVISAVGLVFGFVALFAIISHQTTIAAQEGGSVGLEGRINSAPPTQAATITLPRDGSTISTLPVTVTGICPKGTTVKIFKNNVFGGSVLCTNGSYSIQIDLFSGRNELVARVYDDLDQQGPDSNVVVVNFPFEGVLQANRISLTSSFAKKGANPGESLIWPITLSGGEGPYAVTIDWGDGKTPDVISRPFGGLFDAKHVYDSPGTYVVIVRATDKNGNLAFLQLIGVANGPVGNDQKAAGQTPATAAKTKVLWLPALILIPLIAAAFWLGKKHEVQTLRKKLEKTR